MRIEVGEGAGRDLHAIEEGHLFHEQETTYILSLPRTKDREKRKLLEVRWSMLKKFGKAGY